MIKEIKFTDLNQCDNVYITVDKCSTDVIFSKEKWLNSNDRLWVNIYSDGFASYGLSMLSDPWHGNQPYTWSSRAEVINKELLQGTPYGLIRSNVGVKEEDGKYRNCYFSRGICASVIIPLVEKNADKLHYGIESFKQHELRYMPEVDIEDLIDNFLNN